MKRGPRKMASLPPGSTIGIVGGGQLGRMLAIAAARLGYHARIYDPAESRDLSNHPDSGAILEEFRDALDRLIGDEGRTEDVDG